MSADPFVVDIAEVGLDDVGRVGGKGANLGELTRLGLPVPPGFVVTTEAYRAAMDQGGVRRQIQATFADACHLVDVPSSLEAAATRLQALVRRAGVPDTVRAAVIEAWERLGPDARVAIRSSATAEDAGGTSFAGMHESFVNVTGADEVIGRLVDCWASLFGPRVIAYRAAQGLTSEPDIAVVVHRSVPADRSGVMFTMDPVSGDRQRIVIEGARGFGEVVVGGQVAPDLYVLAKPGLEVIEARRGVQAIRVDGREGGGVEAIDAAAEDEGEVLTRDEALDVARVGMLIEDHYGRPMDVEWVLDGSDLHIVQARPVTGLAGAPPSARPLALRGNLQTGRVLVEGLGAAPGVATGRVRVLTDLADAAKLGTGDVLVAAMTSPDWVPAIRRSVAMVTDQGGLTCHAAIVARELGVPCVVGTRSATTDLVDGDEVTVDGDRGVVTSGRVGSPLAAIVHPVASAAPSSVTAPAPTATRILVNLALADHAEEAAARGADGVGLLRAELMVTDALGGVHPRRLLATGERDRLIERWADPVIRIGRAFGTRPVIYRAIDFRTNEFRGLEGGAEFEPVERNPMIGYRGCYRYIREPDLFAVELAVLERVRAETPNVHLMIPFVRTRWELEACFDAIDASPLGRDRKLQRWIMAEVPSVTYWLPQYAAMGVHGVSIGSNDLTQLVLGVDRDSEQCAALFDEADEAVLDAIERIVTACKEAKIASSLCGQAPSNRPEFVDHLVRFGIDSVSVDPSALDRVRLAVQRSEARLMLAAARRPDPRP